MRRTLVIIRGKYLFISECPAQNVLSAEYKKTEGKESEKDLFSLSHRMKYKAHVCVKKINNKF